MKLKLEVEIELKDEEKEEWIKRTTEYYKLCYDNDMDRVKKTMEENTFENAVVDEIDDLICNYCNVMNCDIKIVN